VAKALQGAQRDLIASGAPATAWAGLVVLGDGDLVPLPGGRKGLDARAWGWIGLAAFLLVALCVYLAVRRRQTTV
jgi:hypothetical protein